MKIGVKITLLVAIAIVGIAIISIMATRGINGLNQMFTDMGNIPVKNYALANDMQNCIDIMSNLSAILCFDQADVDAKVRKCGQAHDEMWKKLDTLKSNAKSPAMIQKVRETEEIMSTLTANRQKFLDAFISGDMELVQEIRKGVYQKDLDRVTDQINKFAEYALGQVYDFAFVESYQQRDATVKVLTICILGVVVLLIIIAFMIITGITKPLRQVVEAANQVAKGNLNVDLTTNSKDETGMVIHSLEAMVGEIKGLIKETNALSSSAIAGRLEIRADASKYDGAYRELIAGINNTLDAVIGPLNITAEYVDRISKGDLPPKITDNYNGDFNEIKNNLNGCIDEISALVMELNKSITEASNGNLQYRADTTKFFGDYRRIMAGVNSLVDTFVVPIEDVSKYLQSVASGDANVQKITKDYKGDFNTIKVAVNTLDGILDIIFEGLEKVAKEAKKGNLDIKTDCSKVQGAWAIIMDSLNEITAAANAIITDAGDTLRIMSTGDLTPRITKNYPGKFGEMKDNINHLGDSLTDLISQLTEAIHTTAAASSEISATADTLAAASHKQSSQTDEVATAMEEMSRTVTDNAQSASRTAEVAKQSGQVANEGGKVVRQTVDKMREISTVVKTSADNIVKLGESSKKIGEIISVIDDIADQTNLLSLNAAIEAARAGEQGRGFAVVADSVGKLAISTASATKEIADMIKGIQHDTEAAVRAMEKGTTEVQSGIELADNAGNSIQNILSGIDELLNMVNQIAAASEEQSTTSEEISKNVSSISKVTAESARNIEDVASTANELAKMTDTLTSLVSQFKIDNSYNKTGNSRYLHT